jgi:transposase
MRMIREVLRLKLECAPSDRQVAKMAGMARSSVGDYLRRCRESGLVWPLSAALSDRDLETCLFSPPLSIPSERRPVPDWSAVHTEMRPPGCGLDATVAESTRR